MKKLANAFLWCSALVGLFTLVPWLWQMLTAKPERTPFTLYSCTVHDFTALWQDEGREYRFTDRKGNTYSDEAQPLFYAAILASKGMLPDSLEGVPVSLEEIERNNLFITSDPRDVNKTLPPVYPVMESIPERLELQEPENALVARRDGFYLYEMASNTLLEEASARLNDTLRTLGFRFPARLLHGNPTDRKDHDEGYLVTDADNRLFRIRQVGGVLQARHFPEADTLGTCYLQVTEFENRATLGMLVTGDGRLAFLRPDGSVAVTAVPFDPRKEDILIIGDMFYYTVKTSTEAGERFYALRSSDFSLVDTLSRPYEPRFTLPGLSFTSHLDSWVKPRLNGIRDY